MHRPDLLVLDEPTVGLDPLIQQTFYALVAEAKSAGATVFLSSHVLPEVQHVADRVALIRDGRLVLVAGVEELRSHALARVAVTFDDLPPAAAFAGIAGVHELERRGNTVLFSLEGEADALVKALALHRVLAIDSHEADLEDIFLTLYQPEEAQMRRNVFLKTLSDARRALVWWSLGLIGMSTLMIAVYPTVRDNPDLNKMVQDYPEALKAFIAFGGELDYVSGAGYLGSELFAFMVPLLLLIAAIGAGARAIAGEEERGTLDLLLANPLSRRRLVLDKLAAVAVEVRCSLSVVLVAALVVGVAVVGMNVSAAHLAAATSERCVARVRVRRDRSHGRGVQRAPRRRDRPRRRRRRRRLSRQLTRGDRDVSRARPGGVALLSLRCVRPVASGARAGSRRLPRAGRARRGRPRDRGLRATRSRSLIRQSA